ncbi:MAG: hypothetical protein Q9160_005093 [Pyrenula sp. 1 TL-2023]
MVYDEFPNLAARYKNCYSPPAVLQCLFNVNPELKKIFFEVFDRTLRMVKSRSDDERLVTVYDKVLLSATSDGQNLGDPGALTLYLEAYHGIDKDDPFEDVAQALEKELAIKALLMKVATPSPVTPLTSLSQDVAPPTTLPCDGHSQPSFEVGYTQISHLPAKPPTPISYSTHPVPSHRSSRPNLSLVDLNRLSQANNAVTNPPIRPRYVSASSRSRNSPSVSSLDRLWSVYLDAKNDYNSSSAPNPVAFTNAPAKSKAAKFLRDTAENTLHELQNNSKFMMIDAEMLDDLRRTFEEARAFVEKVSGGKKRKFDDAEKERKIARGRTVTAVGIPQTKRPRSDGDLANAYHSEHSQDYASEYHDGRRERSLATGEPTMGRYGVERISAVERGGEREHGVKERNKGRKRQRDSSGGYLAADRYRPRED